MTRLLMLSCFLCSVSSGAMAGSNIVGNGGSGIYCPEAQSVKLLDFYEAETIRGLTIDLGGPDLDVDAKVDLALARLKAVDEVRYHRYVRIFADLKQNVRYQSGVELTSIPDNAISMIPRGCTQVQLAAQFVRTFPEDPQFLISQDYWSLMQADDRAGLMLHEIVYFDALRHGQRDATVSRYVNGIISSGKMRTMSREEFAGLLEKFELDQVYVEVPANSSRDGLSRLVLSDQPVERDGARAACQLMDPPRSLVTANPQQLGQRLKQTYLATYYPTFDRPLSLFMYDGRGLFVIEIPSYGPVRPREARVGDRYQVLCGSL